MSTTAYRVTIIVMFALLVLVLAGRLGVSIYQQAHPRDITVWCGDDGHGGWARSYTGPADLVLGACQMAAGTNNP